MFYLASTRFNNETWKQNLQFRIKHNEKAIYCNSIPITKLCQHNCLIFVLEMNNEKNMIEGIGLIRNDIINKNYRIYINNEYNLYVYKGKYWISREELYKIDEEVVEICENILFKGKTHSKRKQGISLITEKLFIYWDYDLETLKHKIKRIFVNLYKDYKETNDEINENNENICLEEYFI